MTMRDEGGWNMQKRQLHRKQSILCLEKLGKIYVIYPERKASISFPETNSNFEAFIICPFGRVKCLIVSGKKLLPQRKNIKFIKSFTTLNNLDSYPFCAKVI